jgi:2-C-methyl-D-erythritol 4-phosphate cytidylyltransferase
LKRFAIIVAGGSGTRMGAVIPKQFIELHGKPILLYSVDAFLHAYPDIVVIIVLPESYLGQTEAMLVNHGYAEKHVKFVAGGLTRFHSVKNGLAQVNSEGIVFIHDAVRCLVTPDLIKRCGVVAQDMGSAIPAIKVRDSMRHVAADGSSSIIDRNHLRIVQTPQTFQSGLIKEAFEMDYREEFTDEASILEFMGAKINLIEGEESNLKITFREDLDFATWKLQKEN